MWSRRRYLNRKRDQIINELKQEVNFCRWIEEEVIKNLVEVIRVYTMDKLNKKSEE